MLYPSLSGDVTQATTSSNDYQALLPLDVNCILKPNSFDIAKMEEPAGRKKLLLFSVFIVSWAILFAKLPMSYKEGRIKAFPTEQMTGLCLSPIEATEPVLGSKLILSKIPFFAIK